MIHVRVRNAGDGKTPGRFAQQVSVPLFLLVAIALASPAYPETGYDLWLRYRPSPDQVRLEQYRQAITSIHIAAEPSPTIEIIAAELQRGLGGLLDQTVAIADDGERANCLVVSASATSPLLSTLGWSSEVKDLGEDGYLIRSPGVPASWIGSRRVISLRISLPSMTSPKMV